MRIRRSDFEGEGELTVSVKSLPILHLTLTIRAEGFTSSGKMVSLNTNKSSGSGKSVLHVLGSSISLMS